MTQKNYPGPDINFRIDHIEAEILLKQYSMLLTINRELIQLLVASVTRHRSK